VIIVMIWNTGTTRCKTNRKCGRGNQSCAAAAADVKPFVGRRLIFGLMLLAL